MTGNLKLFELKKLEDTRMKIVIINGSARKGNTLTAINAFIKGASKKNEIEIIEPDKLNIAPCKGCGVCQCSKGCVDKDDTNPTIDKIAAADMILFATPVYWWGMSAQLKWPTWSFSAISKHSRRQPRNGSSTSSSFWLQQPRHQNQLRDKLTHC